MKISCGWIYPISKYGFPPRVENMYKAYKEMSNLGFKFVELEGLGKDNLTEVINNKSSLLKLYNKLGVKIANCAVILPRIPSVWTVQ